MAEIYKDSDIETTELLYEVVRHKAPKDPKFVITYKTRDENQEGSVGIFVYGGPDPVKSFSSVTYNIAKVHIEATAYDGQDGEERTCMYLNTLMRNFENNPRSPIYYVKVLQARHLGSGPVFVSRNQFGHSIYTVDIEIRYLFKSEL